MCRHPSTWWRPVFQDQPLFFLDAEVESVRRGFYEQQMKQIINGLDRNRFQKVWPWFSVAFYSVPVPWDFVVTVCLPLVAVVSSRCNKERKNMDRSFIIKWLCEYTGLEQCMVKWPIYIYTYVCKTRSWFDIKLKGHIRDFGRPFHKGKSKQIRANT